MKKVSYIVILFIMMLAITACGEKTSEQISEKELVIENAPYKVSIKVPENANYSLVDKKAEGFAFLDMGLKAYVSGDEIFANFSPKKLKASYKTFKEYSDDLTRENYDGAYKNAEKLTINGRDVIKYDYIQVSDERRHIGYAYHFDVNDIEEGYYLGINFIVKDKNPESVSNVFSNTELKKLIDSIKIEKISKSGE